MSLIPEFELGLWNAWILSLSFLLMFIILGILDHLIEPKGSRRPRTPPMNEKERKLDWIATFIFLVPNIYSFFLPLKLGTAWFYIGLLVHLFGIVFTVIAATNLMKAPVDRPVTKGLYRISRNPIYLGTVLIFIGNGIACTSWLYLLLTAIFVVLQDILLAPEERWCLEKYGDTYREYMNRTPRWVGIPKSREPE
jgi:protein-S-isoprenylcysteine O-methyltransferase Ste14